MCELLVCAMFSGCPDRNKCPSVPLLHHRKQRPGTPTPHFGEVEHFTMHWQHPIFTRHRRLHLEGVLVGSGGQIAGCISVLGKSVDGRP
jgi:hypothetical protein